MTFEKRLARLEAIVAELEGDVELARALALFEEGVEHLRAASDDLSKAESARRSGSWSAPTARSTLSNARE